MAANEQNSDQIEDLALKVQSGEKQYEQQLLEALAHYVARVMQNKLGRVSQDSLADLVALTVEGIWQRFSTWDIEKGTLHQWINGIIHNKYVDYVRANVKERDHVEDEAIEDIDDTKHYTQVLARQKDTVESQVVTKELTQQVLAALFEKVEHVDRTIYLMRINYDLTFQELAEIVQRAGYNLSVKAVEQRFYRTRNVLKGVLEELLD